MEEERHTYKVKEKGIVMHICIKCKGRRRRKKKIFDCSTIYFVRH